MKLPYLNRYTDRNGKPRHYFRFPGRLRVALKGEPGSAEFLAAYGEALIAALVARQEQRDRRCPDGGECNQ